MSNFKEVVKESIEKGIILDSCGEVERFYDYGRYIDLCGLDPKDIVENMQNAGTGGGGSSKTNVVINGVVTEDTENGEYYVVFNATSVVLDTITISMIIDGKTQIVTMQPGSTEAKFGPVEKYCEIENITVTPQSTSVAKYSTNVVNPNGKGLFNVSVIKVINNEETLISTNEYKYKDIVKITASDIEGYDFINWDNGIENGDTINIEFEMPEHDVEVRCYYNIKTFTITWLDDDGTTKLASTTVNYGETPVYPNDVPSKVSTKEFNYKFKGWTPNVTAAKDNTTYTAEYLSETRQYEILFVDEDGTELLRTDVEYGKTPTYTGETPTKAATAQYTYTFDGWTPSIEEVTGDATYTATFSRTVNKYTITWKNGNEVLKTEQVEYGTTPSYNGTTPSKAATEQYTYTFDGWTPSIAEVTGDATYTATFSETQNEYTIEWYANDELFARTTGVTYDKIRETECPQGVPSKPADAQYTYTFNGWAEELNTEKYVVICTAIFSSDINEYTIKFVNEDGTELLRTDVEYGKTPTYTGETPTKAATAQYTYTFDGWTPSIEEVTGDATYTATFSRTVNKYTITWKNGNEVLKTEQVEYGTTPSYNGTTPSKAATEQYTYTFSGWDPEITNETTVTGDATYTAQYTSQTRQYNITWKNGDKVLTSTTVNYGETPEYPEDGPKIETPQDDNMYTYTFSGWDPEIKEVTGDATYTACFKGIHKEYTLSVNVENGTYTINPEQETYHYNDKVTIGISPEEGYEYSPLENIITITGDTTLNYVCEAKKYTLTVETVDGTTVHENIPYNSDISQYLIYEPKEGMSHKWMEGNEEFTGNTMPNRNLTLTSVYTEVLNDSKTIYYGAVNTNDVNTLSSTDIQELEHYDYVDGIVQDVIFMLPIRPDLWEEYYTYEDEGNTQEMIEWEKRNSYDYFIAAPSNVSVELINAINAVKNIEAHETININGIEYIKYYTNLGLVAEEKYSATIKMKIIIKIN